MHKVRHNQALRMLYNSLMNSLSQYMELLLGKNIFKSSTANISVVLISFFDLKHYLFEVNAELGKYCEQHSQISCSEVTIFA